MLSGNFAHSSSGRRDQIRLATTTVSLMAHLTKVQRAVLSLLSYVVGSPQDAEAQVRGLSDEEWRDLYECIASHGLSGLCFDVLERQVWLDVMPRRLKIDWHGQVAMAKVPAMRQKRVVGEELATALSEKGIPMVILKGLAFATLYDNPLHREFGDIDCYLMGRKQEGDSVMKAMGAKLEEAGYKHSHLYYKRLMVENHKYLTGFDNTNRGRKCEKYLQQLLEQGPNVPIAEGSSLLRPNDSFTAMFMLKHSLRHFYKERIGLRELVDWAHFIKSQRDMDWESFLQDAEELGLLHFACVMTALCEEYLSVDVASKPLLDKLQDCSQRLGMAKFNSLCDAVLEDLFAPKIEIPQGESFARKLRRMGLRIRRMIRFRFVLDDSIFTLLWANLKYNCYSKLGVSLE